MQFECEKICKHVFVQFIKLRKQTRIDGPVEKTLDYIGSFVYEDDGNFELRYILTGEGRVMVNSNGTYEYQYFLKDHLGNTRVTFNANGDLIQEDSYYPFGMQMNGLCYETGMDYKNKYLYNGKELQDEFGLDWYDYGARFYDAQLGRWHVGDPLASDAPGWTPYRFGFCNPINFTDHEGLFEDWFQNEKTGDVYYHPTMKKGDEGQLGKDWVHLGENEMFGTNDQVLIMINSDKAKTGVIEVPVSDPNTGNEIGKVPMRTALFQGDNAKSFMGEQGYDFKPSTYKFHSDVTTEYHPEAHGQITIPHDNSRIEQVLTSRYIHQDLVLKNTLVLGKYKEPLPPITKSYGPMYSIRDQSWTVRKDIYGTHAFGRKAGRAINWLEKNTPWKSAYENFWKKRIK